MQHCSDAFVRMQQHFTHHQRFQLGQDHGHAAPAESHPQGIASQISTSPSKDFWTNVKISPSNRDLTLKLGSHPQWISPQLSGSHPRAISTQTSTSHIQHFKASSWQIPPIQPGLSHSTEKYPLPDTSITIRIPVQVCIRSYPPCRFQNCATPFLCSIPAWHTTQSVLRVQNVFLFMLCVLRGPHPTGRRTHPSQRPSQWIEYFNT